MSERKQREDSLYWKVEQMADEMQFEVAASHARKGNEVVIMTPRSLPTQEQLDEDYGYDAASRIVMLNTKRLK